MVWWRKGHHGYTCDVSEAHVFRLSELGEYLSADDLVAYPKAEVDKVWQSHCIGIDRTMGVKHVSGHA